MVNDATDLENGYGSGLPGMQGMCGGIGSDSLGLYPGSTACATVVAELGLMGLLQSVNNNRQYNPNQSWISDSAEGEDVSDINSLDRFDPPTTENTNEDNSDTGTTETYETTVHDSNVTTTEAILVSLDEVSTWASPALEGLGIVAEITGATAIGTGATVTGAILAGLSTVVFPVAGMYSIEKGKVEAVARLHASVKKMSPVSDDPEYMKHYKDWYLKYHGEPYKPNNAQSEIPDALSYIPNQPYIAGQCFKDETQEDRMHTQDVLSGSDIYPILDNTYNNEYNNCGNDNWWSSFVTHGDHNPAPDPEYENGHPHVGILTREEIFRDSFKKIACTQILDTDEGWCGPSPQMPTGGEIQPGPKPTLSKPSFGK